MGLPQPPISVLHVGAARLGLSACPAPVMLGQDVAAWQGWGAKHVLTLLPEAELRQLGLTGLGVAVRGAGMFWHRLPVQDYGVPDKAAMACWDRLSPLLNRALDGGEPVLVHCRAGLGRSGMIAALLLCERGLPPDRAMAVVRAARPFAIETQAQVLWLRAWGA